MTERDKQGMATNHKETAIPVLGLAAKPVSVVASAISIIISLLQKVGFDDLHRCGVIVVLRRRASIYRPCIGVLVRRRFAYLFVAFFSSRCIFCVL
mmetsp:Transcript_29945/g.62599  ORF Transcript_29945/g.62599 Transcript_29945/m.62599 type:complete len:96 (-) Transcript_29945:295-582(-)